MTSNYPEDEFEHPPEGSPVGAHRKPPSRWRPVLPFLLVLLIVPALAWGFTSVLQKNGKSGLLENLQRDNSVVQSEDATQSEKETQSEEPVAEKAVEEPAPEPEEPPAPVVDHAVPINVLNDTLVAGYAAEVAGEISAGGFTSVSANNTNGWITEQNTIFYSTPEQEVTAQEIAALTGIHQMVLDPESTGGSGIVVLLAH